MEFEWDAGKAADNFSKHGITFRDASRAFDDVFAIDEEDMTAIDEQRFNKIGIVEERHLFVTYTWRGGRCRLISARLATRPERKRYHAL
jgi:uncharacterized protein